MERFLPQKGFIVASMYAPIMFAPAPVLVFRENVMRKYSYFFLTNRGINCYKLVGLTPSPNGYILLLSST